MTELTGAQHSTEHVYYLRSINLTSLSSRNFLGRGLGAGDNTDIVSFSMSMELLQGDEVRLCGGGGGGGRES